MPMTVRRRIVVFVLFGFGFSILFLLWGLRGKTVSAPGFDGVNQVRMILQKDVTDPELMTFQEIVQRCSLVLRTYGIYRLPEQIIPGLWLDRAFNWSGSGVLA